MLFMCVCLVYLEKVGEARRRGFCYRGPGLKRITGVREVRNTYIQPAKGKNYRKRPHTAVAAAVPRQMWIANGDALFFPFDIFDHSLWGGRAAPMGRFIHDS